MTERFPVQYLPVQYPQASCNKSQPASLQAEGNFVLYSQDEAISFQEYEYAQVNRTIGFYGQRAAFGRMQTVFQGSPLFSTHCKKVFPNEPDFSLIDQFVAQNNTVLEKTLSNLKRCDPARLEDFYRSAFRGLNLVACKAILAAWMGVLDLSILGGIQNTYLQKPPCSGFCIQAPSPLTIDDPGDFLYYILRGNHGEKLPFKRLLGALHFASIEATDRRNVETRLLLREIEIWRELNQ